MDTVIALLLSLFVVMPILTLMHEMGHALPQLVLGKKITVRLGQCDKGKQWKLGRFTLKSSLAPFHLGQCDISPSLSPNIRILVLLAGPMTSWINYLVCQFLLEFNWPYLISYCLNFAVTFTFIQALMTTIPMRYPKFMSANNVSHSDGFQALTILRRARNTA